MSDRIPSCDPVAVGPIAQSVEQRTFNPWVDGSSPSGPTPSKMIQLNRYFHSYNSFVGLIQRQTNRTVNALVEQIYALECQTST